MEDVGICYGPLIYFMVIWCILWPFGVFFHVLVSCTKKNLATLAATVKPLLKPGPETITLRECVSALRFLTQLV
jgi:hypothetical protein